MIYDAVSRYRTGKLSLEEFRDIIGGGQSEVGAETFTLNKELPFVLGSHRFPTLKESEKYLIREALRLAHGNQGTAASLLGISRQALNQRLRRNPSLAGSSDGEDFH
jgi:DNA-binding NtrC family response regulator